MNKSAIKNYAVWARNELIARVSQKAYEYGVTEKETPKYDSELVNGKLLSNIEKKQLNELISQVNKHGFNHVMEEVAYTWFNRFIALRFMEVNNYLPQKINIFTDGNNNFKPQILSEAIHLEIDGVDKKKVFKFIEQNNQEELYKYLLLSVCNDMNKYLPDMFTLITDYKALLIPDHLLNDESVLDRLIKDIPEEDWTDQVQIIGWLYQYYISEKHDEVIDPLRGKTIQKEDIPAATQLFTPDWIVKYMVDNSLGKYLIENGYIELEKKLNYLVSDSYTVKNNIDNLESIKFIDPCMGSGHIILYAFDLFMDIYRKKGYSDKDASVKVVENNVYGIDLDERAYQLSYFSIMMKLRSYNRKALYLNIKHNLSHFIDINRTDYKNVQKILHKKETIDITEYLLNVFAHGKEIGSLLYVDDSLDYQNYLETINSAPNYIINPDLEDLFIIDNLLPNLEQLSKLAILLSKKYDIVCTNPPYLNNKPEVLDRYTIEHYKDFSSDLFSCFIKRNIDLNKEEGYSSYMTPNVWMYIQSFEKLRKYIIGNLSISSFLQLRKGSYKEATVDICSFVLSKKKDILGNFVRLMKYPSNMEEQEKAFLDFHQLDNDKSIFRKYTNQFSDIPHSPISFWLSNDIMKTFDSSTIGDEVVSKAGIVSGKDPLFLRLWFEVDIREISEKSENFFDMSNYKYVPINKGGDYRRWYGNREWVINLYDIWNSNKVSKSVRRGDPDYYFKRCITWSYVTSGMASFRFSDNSVNSTASPAIYPNTLDDTYYILGLLNTNFAQEYFGAFNDTVNLNVSNITSVPYISCDDIEIKKEISNIVEENINICKLTYDSNELSLEFKKSPLLAPFNTVEENYNYYKNKILLWKNKLFHNEERLNKIFANIYRITDYSNNLNLENISIKNKSLNDEIISFISYSVGCMFGRYSLDTEGLAYAGGEWDDSKYKKFLPDKDNIIPIYEDEFYGDDDLTGRFFEFVKVVFGEEELEANLTFIADSLGGKGTPRKVIRDYFINDFFKDHCQMYQVTGSGKRPIYWQFDSGKKNGFKALVYIHRYKPDLIARMRTEYIHPQQARYRTQINMLENQIGSVSKSDEIKIKKEIQTIKEKADELAIYEEKIHHWADKMEPMDLDDGVVNNYNKFQELLVPNVVKKQK